MLLDEHQSKRLFSEAGIMVPKGVLCAPGNYQQATPELSFPWFLKAQVLSGGRGKAGGVLRVEKLEDFIPTAEKIFGMNFGGKPVPFIRVEQGMDYEREFYCSFSISRERRKLLFTIGRQGGTEIESQDLRNLLVQEISLTGGMKTFHIRAAFFHLGLQKADWPGFYEFMVQLYKGVRRYGLLLAEINPLVIDKAGEWTALDGKVEIDDNFLLQHSDLDRFYTPEHASREEQFARTAGLSYHTLSGSVGLMVNGAGLAMATMDLLNASGLPAANFMDLGGAADLDRVRTALRLLFSDDDVREVFLNIFGGVLSCRKVALAIAEALDNKAPSKPMVVRLSGNESEEGQRILRELNEPNLIIVSEVHDAIVALSKMAGDHSDLCDECLDVPGPLPVYVPKPFPPSLNFEKGMPVLVQGITGRTAQLHTQLMLDYGTNIVAGVTPFKGGQHVCGVPVFNSVEEAMQENSIRGSIIFVPAPFAPDAILEAAQNGIDWVVCITDGLSQHDMLSVKEQLKGTKTRLVGPNNPGLIAPGRTKIGIMPGHAFSPGPVAILSRSGTLTYEAASRLTAAGIGQSLCVGIGGDPFIGSTFRDLMPALREDENTKAVVILGEIGGQAEEDLAAYVTETGFKKPVIAFIAGQTAPPGKRLGHAGAILESGHDINDKISAMKRAGFIVCPDLSHLPPLVGGALVRR